MEIAGDARPQPAGWFRFADDKKIADWTLPFEENERDNFAVHRGQERQKRQAEEEEEEWNTDRWKRDRWWPIHGEQLHILIGYNKIWLD